jgi:hypothetical protein
MAATTDWRKEKLASLVQAAAHAIGRARFVLLVSNIAGILILAGLFNSTFPWIRHSIERAENAAKQKKDVPQLSHLHKVEYEDLWTLSAPLLGVKVSVDDLSVVGSSALLVIAIWQFYCVRRETHVVKVIADLSKRYGEEPEVIGYLYHGVAHYFVFTTRFLDDNRKRVGATIAVSILFFMPAWIPILNVLSDSYTLFVPYKGQLPLSDGHANTWDSLSCPERVEAVVRMLFAIVVGGISFNYCMTCRRLDRITRSNVDQMRRRVEKETPATPATAATLASSAATAGAPERTD